MTDHNSQTEPADKRLQRVIISQYQADLPGAAEKFKNLDTDQLKIALAESDAMKNALCSAVFTLGNELDKLAGQIRALTESINAISKAVEEMPDMIRNTLLTALSKPAGGGKAN